MKIGIIGNGFVGRATQIFAKNYFAQDSIDNNNVERFEVLPDTVTTRAKPNSVMTYSAEAQDAAPPHHTAAEDAAPPHHTAAEDAQESNVVPAVGGRNPPTNESVATAVGGRTPPFFKRILFKPIQVYIYDIRPEACQPPGITLEDLDRECDILFFCLPTPLHHDGSCYTRILEETIARCSNPYKVIRSTVPVGFAAKHGCYFMPEFLTEANWENDFRGMKEWVVGIPAVVAATATTDEFKTRIQKLIKRSHKNSAIDSPTVFFCDTNEAEMLKLMKNCFLSAKVGLMNEFYDFCAATHTDYNNVTTLAKRDARMGTSHFQVPGVDGRRGFGGTCFPKDTHSLYCQMNAHGITPHIYPAILARNDTVDRPEREWSRDVWRTTIPLPTPASKVVVVFSDTRATTASSYLTDVIRTNLAKNNVVIQVVRAAGTASQTIHKNHLVKHRPGPNTPLFFPRVDECYYTTHTGDALYDIMREVSNVIDLWDSHEEMKLYVVKKSRYDDESEHEREHESEHECECGDDTESGTEGFDSDADVKPRSCDYAGTILEEYFTKVLSVKPNQKRGLTVMF
jgi:UDPglucose 6-dehydrogenase